MTAYEISALATPPDPGWSNSPPDDGIGATEPPPVPIDMWTPGWSNSGTATGATAGTPGAWAPAGTDAPADLAAAGAVTPSPATAWTTGQYVVLGDASHAYWDGAAWVAGEAP